MQQLNPHANEPESVGKLIRMLNADFGTDVLEFPVYGDLSHKRVIGVYMPEDGTDIDKYVWGCVQALARLARALVLRYGSDDLKARKWR